MWELRTNNYISASYKKKPILTSWFIGRLTYASIILILLKKSAQRRIYRALRTVEIIYSLENLQIVEQMFPANFQHLFFFFPEKRELHVSFRMRLEVRQ